MIGKFGSSETFCGLFFPQTRVHGHEPPEMLLQGVMAEANLAKKCDEAFGFAVFKRG